MELNYPQKSNGLYILSGAQIDDIASMVLHEYMPWVLEYPRPVDIVNLLEEGLFLTLINQMLGLRCAVLGMTVFEDITDFPCMDDMYRPITMNLPAGTVLIHSWLLGYESKARRRFTIAHEVAHWILHRSYHSPTNQKFQFRSQRSPFIACRDANIERKWHNLMTDEDWEEWQADSLASALLMPSVTFRPFVENLMYKSGCRCFTEGKVTRDYIETVEETANRFTVSKAAVEIRMKHLGLIKKSGIVYYYTAT